MPTIGRATLVAVALLLAACEAAYHPGWTYAPATPTPEPTAVPTPAPTGSPPPGYTLAEVRQHDDAATSCWVIVDGMVFDLTRFSRFHPTDFQNCGGDSSVVYHRRHGPVVRPQMMEHHIGRLLDAGA